MAEIGDFIGGGGGGSKQFVPSGNPIYINDQDRATTSYVTLLDYTGSGLLSKLTHFMGATTSQMTLRVTKNGVAKTIVTNGSSAFSRTVAIHGPTNTNTGVAANIMPSMYASTSLKIEVLTNGINVIDTYIHFQPGVIEDL